MAEARRRVGGMARRALARAGVDPRRAERILRPARLGGLRRTAPISERWGFDRGTPIDRHYIESFLAAHRADVRGRVLEVRDDAYARRFGGGRARADVLDVDPSNPRATIVADLADCGDVPGDRFDCFILTQTLQLVYDVRAAVGHAHRLLAPGGVLLATVPSITRVVPRYGVEADHWRFTVASCRRLFGDAFGAENVRVRHHGNHLAAVAFLAGLAAEELRPGELDAVHEGYPVIIGVRAVKAGPGAGG